MDRLLRPASIAVIGGGPWCANVIRELDRIGYAGAVWQVHPSRGFASVADLPGAPDAAFVGVNRQATVQIVRDLAARGAGGAVCFASGFAEAGAELSDGTALQAELAAAAGTMPILGPNCYGFINALDGAALWPDQHGMVRVDRGVAVVTQSSNIAINLTMQRRGLPIAYMVTAGNQAQTGLARIGAALLADPRVTALGLHIEGIGDVAAFAAMAAQARALGKPVVALKTGLSDQARAAGVSHTASITGSDAAARALLARLGIAQVDSLTVLLEVLKLLHLRGPLPSRRIASMSCSGGEAGLMADSGLRAGVEFPPLTPAQAGPLRAVLGPQVALSNPLDYHTFIWNDRAAMTACFRAMMTGDLALGCVVLDFPRADRCAAVEWQAVVDAVADAPAPMALVSSLPENMPEAVAQDCMARGILPMCGMTDALAAIAAAHLPVA
ncbi:MAG: CoA-binding protein, partial [Paracoccus sp. (in: a-proteobacteria)]|nr:CoA-binding protein [Paracoccus sp. (in: a-proteobacteria)]